MYKYNIMIYGFEKRAFFIESVSKIKLNANFAIATSVLCQLFFSAIFYVHHWYVSVIKIIF